MKKYYVPATEVVAFMSEAMIMAGSSVGPTPIIDPADPNGANTIGGGDD